MECCSTEISNGAPILTDRKDCQARVDSFPYRNRPGILPLQAEYPSSVDLRSLRNVGPADPIDRSIVSAMLYAWGCTLTLYAYTHARICWYQLVQ